MNNSPIYWFSESAIYLFGYQACLSVPFLFLLYISYSQIKSNKISIVGFSLLLSVYPAVTPVLTQLAGYKYFTYLNNELQTDEALKVSAVILIAIFSMSIIAGSKFKFSYPNVNNTKIIFSSNIVILVFITNFFLIINFLEAESIIYKGYSSDKSQAAPFSSLVNQIFNASVAIFLCYISTKSRYRIFLFVIIGAIVISLLMSRRTLALSLGLILLLTRERNNISFSQILWVLLIFSLMWLVGEVRNSGILNYLSQGVKIRPNFTLPGGAANVFIGMMGAIDLLQTKTLSFLEAFPIFTWVIAIYESDVYVRYGYDYNGGMMLPTIGYWNFGVLGVILFGAIIGAVSNRCDYIFKNIRSHYSGTLSAMLAIVFVITLPNTLWYKPIGLIKLTIAVSACYLICLALRRITLMATQ